LKFQAIAEKTSKKTRGYFFATSYIGNWLMYSHSEFRLRCEVVIQMLLTFLDECACVIIVCKVYINFLMSGQEFQVQEHEGTLYQQHHLWQTRAGKMDVFSFGITASI